MDFFLEIHNGECGLGEHFCDQVRSVSTQAEVRTRSQIQKSGGGNEKESALS